MLRSFTSVFTLLLSVLVSASLQAQTVSQPPASPPPAAPPKVGFAIIKTSQVAVPQALLVPGGDITRQVNSNFSAFLIKHHGDYLLFDTGLGEQIDAQYQQGMPLWWRPFFTYDKPVVSARTQLAARTRTRSARVWAPARSVSGRMAANSSPPRRPP